MPTRDETWTAALDRLRAFKREHGHAQPPQRYRSADGFVLGSWLCKQRAFTGLTPARRQDLLDLGVVFDLDKVQRLGNASPNRAQEYASRRERTVEKFAAAAADGVDLSAVCDPQILPPAHAGLYKTFQRLSQRRTAGRLSPDVEQGLTALGVNWDVSLTQARIERQRQTGFDHLMAELTDFIDEHGHARVPAKHKTASGYGLYSALYNRRVHAANGTLRPEYRQRLTDAGFDVDGPIRKNVRRPRQK